MLRNNHSEALDLRECYALLFKNLRDVSKLSNVSENLLTLFVWKAVCIVIKS